MMNPNAVDPKFALIMHDGAPTPTLNEQATARMLYTKHHNRVQEWVNPVVARLLNSRLHWLISSSVLLITFCGRKSGRFLSTPVNYVSGPGGLLYITSAPDRTWWHNLIGGAPVTVCLKGQSLDGLGTAVTEPKAVAAELARLIEFAPSYRKLLSIGLTPDGNLQPADVLRAAQHHIVVRVQLH